MPAPFDEEGYRRFVSGEGKAWFKENVKRSSFSSYDKKNLSYICVIREEAKKVIVVSHGFTEYGDKYLEFMYDLWERGFSVYVPEHRGHGYSYRRVPETDRVDIDSFDTYVLDFKCFMDTVVCKAYPDTGKYLFCHSMGSTIGAMFLEKYQGYFERAVFNSPMFKLFPDVLSGAEARLLFVLSSILRWNDKLLPGQPGFEDRKYDFESSACTSEERYRYDMSLRLGDEHFHTAAGTYTWGRAALLAIRGCMRSRNISRIRIPILIFRAGKDYIVDTKGCERFSRLCKSSRIVDFPEAKHEIFNSGSEVLTKYYDELFDFFG